MDTHVLCALRRIKRAQDKTEPFEILRRKLARIIIFVQALQAAVPEAYYHKRIC